MSEITEHVATVRARLEKQKLSTMELREIYQQTLARAHDDQALPVTKQMAMAETEMLSGWIIEREPPEATPAEFLEQLRAQGKHDQALSYEHTLNRVTLEDAVSAAQAKLANATTTWDLDVAQRALEAAQAQLGSLPPNPLHQHEARTRELRKELQQAQLVVNEHTGKVHQTALEVLEQQAAKAEAALRTHEDSKSFH